MNISIEYLGCFMMLCAAFITDIKSMRIPNYISISGMIIGLAWNFIAGGWTEGLLALQGTAVGFGLMLILYWFGAVGGGDVKLFGAIGAWLGTLTTLYIMLYSIFAAGLIGVIVLVWRREALSRLREMIRRLLGAYIIRSWIPIRTGVKNQLQIPFMLAVLPGAILSIYHLS